MAKMLLKRWFGDRGERDAALGLYTAVVAQARRPVFYREFGVPDTVDGRFELICLHAFLVMRRLKADPAAMKTSQALFDTMFADMDRSLREMGAGDLGVGKRVKSMAKAFYGRIGAYEAGLNGAREDLCAALRRNVYRRAAPDSGGIGALADYVAREDAALRARDLSRILTGDPSFGDPVTSVRDGTAA